jgi:hypothetical protein
MAAIAELKALLKIDTSQYKAGVQDATGATHSMAMSLSNTERQLGNTAQVARGLGQIFSGNVSSGIRGIIYGLDLIPGKATIAIAKIGAVIAAAAAGWSAGGWLDKTFNISGRIGEAFGGKAPSGPTEGEPFKQARRAKLAARDIDDATDKSRLERLKGKEKIEAEYFAKLIELNRAMSKTQDRVVLDAYGRQLEAAKQFYAEDLAAFEAAEKEKIGKQLAAALKIEKQFKKRQADILEAPFNATGRDIKHDQMAAVGGMVGVSRTGTGAADKMLQRMIEDARRQDEIIRLQKEANESLADLNAQETGR